MPTVYFDQLEDDMRYALRQPWHHQVGWDGGDDGEPLSAGNPHPRYLIAGSFVRG